MHRGLKLAEEAQEADLTAGPCLVHLVREVNGLRPLREFAAALREHPPGIDHELVLAMKGFTSTGSARPYLKEVEDLAPRVVFFPDRGLDLGVYFATADLLRRERYCFVNSNGRPLVTGWLAKMDAALQPPGVGQVGATGSWASQRSWLMYSMGLPSAYRGLMPSPQVARRQMLGMELERHKIEQRSLADRVRTRARTLAGVPEGLLGVERFPAHHIRPNAFMIKHSALTGLELFVVRNKTDTSSLEVGRRSITRQLQEMGLTSLVVDSAGAAYEPDRWDRSCTLYQGDQQGLLVADNQTHFYAHGDEERRSVLSTIAWGPRANPS